MESGELTPDNDLLVNCGFERILDNVEGFCPPLEGGA